MQKELSIIIPIHNDADTIGYTIDSILDFFNNENIYGELIIVNDGGTKEGVDIVNEKIKNGCNILFFDRGVNKGKGYTIKEGIVKSSGKIIFYMDADLPYGIDALKKMYNLLKTGNYDLAIVNRNLSGKDGMKQAPLIRKLAHFVYSLIVGPLVQDCTDPAAGLKGMTRQTAERFLPLLTIDRFAFDIELIFLANKLDLRISQTPAILQQSGKSKNLSLITDSPQMIKDVLKIAWRNKLGFYN
ncbi:MAG: glycosyltransferase [bacterium]|nr:glycosyltransferase [bacterium]